MARGYMGKVLFVDLSSKSIEEIPLEEDLCRNYLGGYGIAVKILYDRMEPGIDPLGPDNILGFMTGPLTGTPAIIGSRYVVVSKSPLTGNWGEANSGGYFGPALKWAGYDGVFFTGISEQPIYLVIDNGEASLVDARQLWGKNSHETDDLLKTKYGKDCRVACIGPSGEKMSLIAAIINDKTRAAARSGLAAVMGSKKLKAIVVKGNMEVPMVDLQKAKTIRRENIKKMDVGFGPTLKQYGTMGITESTVIVGDSPVKNWGGVGIDDFPTVKRISDESVLKYQKKKYACWNCPLACGGVVEVKEGPYKMKEAAKPEYETLWAFGTMCLNDDVESIIKVNNICNKSGLDTMSTGSVVAFAIECYENGILTKEDTDGLDLRWGNAEAIVELTEKIARREGVGALLADGVKVAAEKIGKGSENYAIHIGGQEPAGHDPKFIPGIALTYFLDPTPARHTAAGELTWPPSGVDIEKQDRLDYTNRGKDHATLMKVHSVVQAAGLCSFGFISMDFGPVPEFLEAVTGWKFNVEDIYKLGERIGTARHLFNLREGINPLNRSIPGRMIGEPLFKGGPNENITVDIETMIHDYLTRMDWDLETTMPSKARLEALGLVDMAKEIDTKKLDRVKPSIEIRK